MSTIQQALYNSFKKNSNKVAIQIEDQSFSYSELYRITTNIKLALLQRKFLEKRIIGIYLENEFHIINTILGILGTKAVFAPLDAEQPISRIRSIIKSSNIELIITNKKKVSQLDKLNISGVEIIYIEDVAFFKNITTGIEEPAFSPDDMIYLYFTSGSTGIPNAIIGKNKSLLHFIDWEIEEFAISNGSRFAQFTNPAFDAFLRDVFTPLLSGGTIVVSRYHKKLLESRDLMEWIDAMNINYIHCVPSMFQLINNDLVTPELFKSLKAILMSGESQNPEKLKSWYHNFDEKIQLVNFYGSTETTMIKLFHRIRKSDVENNNIPIGKPISGTRAIVLNENKKVCADGVLGEIYIRTPYRSYGYLNNPELNNSRFIVNPFNINPNDLIFKTDDLGIKHKNGNFEWVSRKDDLVKINGIRVELKDIEKTILAFDGIKDTLVIYKKDNYTTSFYAYYIRKMEVDKNQLVSFLSTKLPDYMIPASFIELQKFPLTPNGKLDKKALPKPDMEESIEFQLPENELEEIMLDIWAGLLNMDKTTIGTNSNFFSLGGDSIKTILVASRLKQNGYKISVGEIFKYPTIRMLSKVIQYSEDASNIIDGSFNGSLLPTQQLFLKTKANDEIKTAWGSAVLSLKNHYDKSTLLRVCQKFVQRHENLQSVLEQSDGQFYLKKIKPSDENFPFSVVVIDNDAEIDQYIKNWINCIIDNDTISNGPLIAFCLFTLKSTHKLVISVHRLLMDSTSWRILIDDFYNLLQQNIFEKEVSLTIDETGFISKWLREMRKYAKGSDSNWERQYWTRIDSIENKTFFNHKFNNIPGNIHNESVNKRILSKELSKSILDECNFVYNTSAKELFIVSYFRAFQKMFRSSEIKLLVSNKIHQQKNIGKGIQDKIGWINSFCPLWLNIDESGSLSDQIIHIKEEFRRVPNNGEYYSYLSNFDYTASSSEKKSNPPYLIGFQFEDPIEIADNEFFSVGQIEGIHPLSYEYKPGTILDVVIEEVKGSFISCIIYDNTKFKGELIDKFSDVYIEEVETIANHCKHKKIRHWTPSDFGAYQLSIEDLKVIQEHIETEMNLTSANISLIYPLSPLQKGMLYHTLYEDGSNMYYLQKIFTLKGGIVPKYVEGSLNKVMEKYDILRTIFISDKVSQPWQVVLKNRRIDFSFHDISGFPTTEKAGFLEELKLKDFKNKFNLSNDVLMRAYLLRISDDQYTLVWTYHHIIIDGWDLGIIYNDFLKNYAALNEGKELKKEVTIQYKSYMDWLEKKDRKEALEYWQNYLTGYEYKDHLSVISDNNIKDQDQPGIEEMIISQDMTNSILDLAKKFELTLNLLMQTCWGILLMKYINSLDIVFGAVVSGRPAEIDQVDKIVGLFINTIPVRFKIESTSRIIDVAKNAYIKSMESNQYEYVPVNESCSSIPNGSRILDHIFIFENHPFEISSEYLPGKDVNEFTIDNYDATDHTNYDFSLIVLPTTKNEIFIQVKYNKNKYAKILVKQLLNHYQEILMHLINNSQMTYSELKLSTRIDTITSKRSENSYFSFG